MNIIIVTGNLGRDAEFKQTASGTSVLNFSLANSTGYKDNKKTQWFRCALFGKRAESLADHLLKGTKLMVTGELEQREYEAKDGTKKISVEIFVKELELIGGKQEVAKAPAKTDDDSENILF